MKLITAAIWLIAAVLSGINAMNRQDDIVWAVVTVVFAANAIRWIVKYFKEKKQTEEE